MESKTLKSFAIALALTGALTVSASAASIGGATVTATDVNFRAEASTDSRIFTRLEKGTEVIVGDNGNDDWYRVCYKGTSGFISAKYLSFNDTMDGDFGVGEVRGNDVRMRVSASITSSIKGTYNNGTKMTVLGVSGNWYKVDYNGTVGYIHSDFFALNCGVSEFVKKGSSSEGQLIVDTAMKYLGTPYVWGGTSTAGFDCSGLVYYVYKECGYTINRTAATIYTNGVAVDKNDLQVGDAICFSSSSNSIGHVGIYIGDGQFIHASSGSGKVIITDVDTTYYVNNYVGARRIV